MPDPVPQSPQPAGWQSFLFPLLRPFRVRLSLAIAAMVADAVLTVLRPWPLKLVIDNVLHRRSTARLSVISRWIEAAELSRMQVLSAACVGTLLIAVSTGALTHFFTLSMGAIAHRFVHSLRCRVFSHVQRLSLSFHEGQRTGELTSRLVSDAQAVQEVIANGVITLVSNSCLLAGMLVAMLWLNWRFALLALSVTPVLFWTVYRSTHRVRAAAKAARQSDGLLASLTQETLASIRLVQGLAQEQQQDERFRKQGDSSLEAYLEGVRYQARLSPIVDLLAGLGLAIVMWYGATRVMARVITTGDLVIFFAYVTNLYSPMRALSRLSFSSSKARAATERIGDLLRAHRDVADPPHAKQCPRARGHIHFENVSFSYDGRTFILNDINLEIAPGERVAIVGATGAGKSSLVSLVPRFFDPVRGTVYIDGHDVRNYSVASYRENISLVLQETLLFRATVRENIAFGRPDATDKQIVAAANVAQANEFIRDLPEGYNTVLAERGVTLSGGQRQRIAIARAVLRDAPILILDEPTSGLDANSEQLVVKALEQAAAGRTSLMITHRLASASFADRIIVLEQSRIVEEGTHQQLMSRGGRYAELFRLQLDDRSAAVPLC